MMYLVLLSRSIPNESAHSMVQRQSGPIRTPRAKPKIRNPQYGSCFSNGSTIPTGTTTSSALEDEAASEFWAIPLPISLDVIPVSKLNWLPKNVEWREGFELFWKWRYSFYSSTVQFRTFNANISSWSSMMFVPRDILTWFMLENKKIRFL